MDNWEEDFNWMGDGEPTPKAKKPSPLETVRPFERPMTAQPNDRIVAEDELGNKIYETDTGQRYTIRPATAEESRTTRAKVEDWVDEGAPLPSGEQVLEALKQMPKAVIGSMEDLLAARGTVGDVVGAAATMAAPGVTRVLNAPEETLVGMFGGRKATSPGLERGYSPLPETVGADNQYRFEFSDREAVVIPSNIRQVNVAKEPFDVNKDSSTLADVLIHDELFYQYPKLADQKIVIDEALANSSTRGYYNSSNGLMAISPDLLKDPEQLRKTLLHEIQHVIQTEEGFAGGTSPFALEVLPKAQEIATRRAEIDKAEEEKFKQELESWEKFDWEAGYLSFEDSLQKFVEGVGIDYEKLLQNDVDVVENRDLWILQRQIRQVPKKFFEKKQLYQKGGTYARDFFNDDMAFILYRVAEVSEKDPQFAKSFSETFSVSPSQILAFDQGERRRFLEEKGFGKEKPRGKFKYDTSDQITYFDREEAYRTKKGETEARNTATRMNMTVAERFKAPPESTEDVARKDQWGDPRFAEGGMVENIDPISGNPVPPGAAPKEVRDDVPIMASEGEYVIPANVVRYLGLERIEKLVSSAKQKLEELDAAGRIGGKQEEEDDLPFTAEELVVSDEEPQAVSGPPMMSEGGLVTGQDTLDFNTVDPATGLPLWLAPVTPNPVTPTPTPTPRKSLQDFIADRERNRGDERSEELPTTGLARPVQQWSPEDFTKYANTRNSVDNAVFRNLAGNLPFGGLAIKGATRLTEKNVVKSLEKMVESGKDLNGNPLSTEQVEQMKKDLSSVKDNPLDTRTGVSGVSRKILEEQGVLKPREPKEKPKKGQELVSKAVQALTGVPAGLIDAARSFIQPRGSDPEKFDFSRVTGRGAKAGEGERLREVSDNSNGSRTFTFDGDGYTRSVTTGSTAPTSSPRPKPNPKK